MASSNHKLWFKFTNLKTVAAISIRESINFGNFSTFFTISLNRKFQLSKIELGVNKGFGVITLLLGIGLFVLLGSGIAAATVLNKKNNAPPKDSQSKSNNKTTDQDKKGQFNGVFPSPPSEPNQTGENQNEATPSSTTQAVGTTSPTIFEQPAKLYKITLPTGWVTNSTLSTNTYSTTTFSGPSGNISVTFGSNKDPIGGCSDPVTLILSDRVIPACFLLKKDGSRLISRGYTKSSGNLQMTIEGYINTPLNSNEKTVLDIIKTIDIN